MFFGNAFEDFLLNGYESEGLDFNKMTVYIQIVCSYFLYVIFFPFDVATNQNFYLLDTRL